MFLEHFCAAKSTSDSCRHSKQGGLAPKTWSSLDSNSALCALHARRSRRSNRLRHDCGLWRRLRNRLRAPAGVSGPGVARRGVERCDGGCFSRTKCRGCAIRSATRNASASASWRSASARRRAQSDTSNGRGTPASTTANRGASGSGTSGSCRTASDSAAGRCTRAATCKCRAACASLTRFTLNAAEVRRDLTWSVATEHNRRA